MDALFSLENLFTLAMLILLQAVLGFDNLLYIAIESQRVDPARRRFVRQTGIGLAIVFRLLLLVVVMGAISAFQEPFIAIRFAGIIEGEFTLHAVITLLGGAFIIYTATAEILHFLAVEEIEGVNGERRRSVFWALFWIVSMNAVFSFDSLLSAIALTHVVPVMATAIIAGGVLMLLIANQVAAFLKKNRMYEVLGLFILFIVGVLLVSEGGHLAHLRLFAFEVTPMSKTTFYFVIFVLVCVNIVQSRYRRKLEAKRARERAAA
ncbi:MAG: TerC family protein [Parvularculaceae bacterium]